jgi:hypothetical protein
MMLFTPLRATQEIQRLRADVIRRGYETGYYGLADQSQQWIDSHVRVVAQNLYGSQVVPAMLRTDVEQLEATLGQATVTATATRTQVDLQPALVPTFRWPRMATVCAAIYLVGEVLQLTVGRLTTREWLTLCVAIGLATTPWVLGLPIVAGCRSRLSAWRAARTVRSLHRRMTKKRAKLERTVAQASRVEQWVMTHIAALQQDHNGALEPAKKAREQMARLDSFTPLSMGSTKLLTNGQDNPPPPFSEAAQPMTIHEEPALV